MNGPRRSATPDLRASLLTLEPSPPNPHRVCCHANDVLWIASNAGGAGWRADSADQQGDDSHDAQRVLACLRDGRWPELVELLGLDFTLAALLSGGSRLLSTRGPASRVPMYVAAEPRSPLLATRLWTATDGGRVATDFLRQVLANAYLPAPIECDDTLRTASTAWLRTPRGAVLEWRDGRTTMLARYACPSSPHAAQLDDAACADWLRGAVDARILALAGRERVASELSGGIDSGIVAARARALLAERYAGGVTLIAPYHELRRERAFVDATLEHIGTTTRYVDIAAHLPFTELRSAPVHDEPSLASLPWMLLTGVLAAARDLGAGVLCHGIGGDQVFTDPPARFGSLHGIRDGLAFADARLRLGVRHARRRIRRLYFGGERSLAASPAILLHDGWCDRYLAPALGLRYEGVFVDLEILRACEVLRSRRTAAADDLPKSLPRRVFAAELAPPVLARRGKAGFDGVYQRGLQQNIDAVCDLLDTEAGSLEDARLKPAPLIGRIRECATRGWGSGDTPVFAALAWAVWVHTLRRDGRLPGP